jgi:phage antirepressor YoqD-like protein
LNNNTLLKLLPHNIPIPLNKDVLIKVTEIASFLNISESNLVAILQNAQISIENVEEFLPFIYRIEKR